MPVACGSMRPIPSLFATRRSISLYMAQKVVSWAFGATCGASGKRGAGDMRVNHGASTSRLQTPSQSAKEIAERNQFGHWEGDLIAFRKEFGKSNLTSLVERRSRYIVLTRNPSRHSKGVLAGIEHHLGPLPQLLRQSITFDRGTEFAAFATLKTKLGMTSYFCKPSAPWQKGSVETATAVFAAFCRFLSLDTDIIALPDSDLAAITQRLNNTPRKCLGFRTPTEVIGEQIAGQIVS